METNYNSDMEIIQTPKSPPKYSVGRIIIHSDEEAEVEGEEWLRQFQVAPPPRSPSYSTNNETEDQSSDEQASVGTSSDEKEKEERHAKIVSWHGRLNLNIISEITTISGESLQTFGLQNIKSKVQTIECWKNGFQIHQLKPTESTIWIPKNSGTISILTGPKGIITNAYVKMVTNRTNNKRSDKEVIHLTKFADSKSEDGMDLPELDQFKGRLLMEANGSKWRNIIGRQARVYISPRATDGIYTRMTGLKECINAWYTNGEEKPPLISVKAISIIHSRNEKKTNKPSPTATTASFQL